MSFYIFRPIEHWPVERTPHHERRSKWTFKAPWTSTLRLLEDELSYPCDSCDNWQHNVRSIALALQALRAVDRYGVTRRAEQYRGWGKLPAPGEMIGFTSVAAAKEFIAEGDQGGQSDRPS